MNSFLLLFIGFISMMLVTIMKVGKGFFLLVLYLLLLGSQVVELILEVVWAWVVCMLVLGMMS